MIGALFLLLVAGGMGTKPGLPIVAGTITDIAQEHYSIGSCVSWKYTIKADASTYQAEHNSCGFRNRKQKFTKVGGPVRFSIRGNEIGILENGKVSWLTLVKQEPLK